MSASDVQAAAPALRTAKVVLAQLEVPVEAVMTAFRLAREAGAKTVLDPAPAVPLPDELLRLVDVIRPNSGEAQVLTGFEVTDHGTARQACRELLDRGVGAAVVQAGDEGDLLVSQEADQFFPRLPVKELPPLSAPV